MHMETCWLSDLRPLYVKLTSVEVEFSNHTWFRINHPKMQRSATPILMMHQITKLYSCTPHYRAGFTTLTKLSY